MKDAADLAQLRQHWRDIRNTAARADAEIVRRLIALNRIRQSPHEQEQAPRTASALHHSSANLWRLMRQVQTQLHVLEARIGPDPQEAAEAAADRHDRTAP